MAEIHVQAKKQHSSPMWIWIIVGLLIAAAVIYFVTTRNNRANETAPVNQNNTTSGIEIPQRLTNNTFMITAA